jgi:hypothetical protein
VDVYRPAASILKLLQHFHLAVLGVAVSVGVVVGCSVGVAVAVAGSVVAVAMASPVYSSSAGRSPTMASEVVVIGGGAAGEQAARAKSRSQVNGIVLVIWDIAVFLQSL